MLLKQFIKNILKIIPWQQDKALQTKTINTYINDNQIRKVQFGCGPNQLKGWLNTDIVKSFDEVVFLDITEKFPFPSNAIDFMTSEHLIEHINFKQAKFFLSECLRTLKPNGVLRITTPDLTNIINLYQSEGIQNQNYIDYICKKFIPDAKYNNDVFVINNAFRNWGHQFLYNRDTLLNLLEEVGFKKITQVSPGISEYDSLFDVDSRNKGDLKEINSFEVMVFEAIKGGDNVKAF